VEGRAGWAEAGWAAPGRGPVAGWAAPGTESGAGGACPEPGFTGLAADGRGSLWVGIYKVYIINCLPSMSFNFL